MGTQTIKIAILCLAALALRGAEVERKETIRKTFTGVREVEVDNVHGAIRVTGYDGNEVQAVIERTVRAESEEAAKDADRDVHLDMRQPGDKALFYVDGPFRCGDDGGNCRGWRHYGYQVSYDFELKAPRQAKLILKTVNHGPIHVEHITGDYEIRDVNAGIEMLDVAGSGTVSTINGGVKAVFSRNPAGKTSFKTLNGTVDVTFRPELSADLYMKTFNGAMYTDFDVVAMAVTPSPAGEVRDGKRIYRGRDFNAVRVGRGGPELRFESFNGKILIKKAQ